MPENENIELAEPTADIVVKTDDKPETQPQYVLLMGDSPCHSVEWVVEVCGSILGMNTLQGLQTALTIHNEGKAPVFKGAWDECVLKRDQIRSKGGDELVKGAGIESGTIPVWIEEG